MSLHSVSKRIAGAAALALLASGCAYPISKPLRRAAAGGPSFAAVMANPDAYPGRIVIWGGVILQTTPAPQGSEVAVLQTPLDSWLEPWDARLTQGRFIAKTSGFLDPALYARGSRVTVAGAVAGKKVEQFGMATSTWPVLDVQELYLWPPEPFVYYYAASSPYWGSPWGWSDPYWGWYGAGWGFWWGGTFDRRGHDHGRHR